MPTDNVLATDGANVKFIEGISLVIPDSNPPGGSSDWRLIALPEVTESREVVYSDIPIMGRSAPVTTFSSSGYRRFEITFHLHSLNEFLLEYHKQFVRAIISTTYPELDGTFRPPTPCWLRCGALISGPGFGGGSGYQYVRILFDRYSYTLDPEHPWLNDLDLMPQYLAVQTSVRVAYSYASLPGRKDVLGGRF